MQLCSLQTVWNWRFLVNFNWLHHIGFDNINPTKQRFLVCGLRILSQFVMSDSFNCHGKVPFNLVAAFCFEWQHSICFPGIKQPGEGKNTFCFVKLTNLMLAFHPGALPHVMVVGQTACPCVPVASDGSICCPWICC